MPYEYHIYKDTQLKILFHRDIMLKDGPEFVPQWHKNPELLLFIDGEAIVCSDELRIMVSKGEIAIVDSNRLHKICPITEKCEYYCLIPDASVYAGAGNLPVKSSDPEIIRFYNQIAEEYQHKRPYYREVISGYVQCLLALLARQCSDDSAVYAPESTKFHAVKAAIQYIYEHFEQSISIDDICRSVGLSRYYMCHIFKEITGQTMLRHLNYVRCHYALSLLSTGEYNVAQSAYASGFSNISYFSKTYKSIIGNLPSVDFGKAGASVNKQERLLIENNKTG